MNKDKDKYYFNYEVESDKNKIYSLYLNTLRY